MSKRKSFVILGGGGVIGSALTKQLLLQNAEVILPKIDLLEGAESVRETFYELGKCHNLDSFTIVNCAWSPKPTYENRNNPINLKWVQATSTLTKIASYFGADFYGLGSCVEKNSNVQDLYARSKIECSELISNMQNDLGSVFGWLRIHYVSNRNPTAPAILRYVEEQLIKNPKKAIQIRSNSMHDYLDLRTVVSQIILALKSRVSGLIDIGSGSLTTNAELVKMHFPNAEIEVLNLPENHFHYSGTADLSWIRNS